MQNDEEPKIIIDSDWKEQAQKEKEQLSNQPEEVDEEELTFLDIIEPIIMETAIALGGAMTEEGEMIEPDIDLAEHHLKVLSIIYTKTQGNLNKEEKEVLETALAELNDGLASVYFTDDDPED